MIITIDGSVATGSGTLAKNLSLVLGIPKIDSGSIYRAITFICIQEDAVYDEAKCVELAENAQIDMPDGEVIKINDYVMVEWVDGQKLDRNHTAEIDQNVPTVAGYKKVRDVVNAKQREFAANNGAVADGRDCGTVVFPSADVKLFLTVSDEEAARRRGAADGRVVSVNEIRERNDADRRHKFGALAKADDAIEIDTTNLDAGQVAEKALGIIKSKFPDVTFD